MRILASGVLRRRGPRKTCTRPLRLGMLLPLLFLFASSVARGQSCFPAPAGIVGWWPAEGNANDIIGTNNGTLVGGATATTNGEVGTAFSFDGTNGYAQFPDSPVFHPTNFTVEAWINFSSLNSKLSGGATAGEQYIIFKQNTQTLSFSGFLIAKVRITGGDVFYFSVDSGSGQNAFVQGTNFISTHTWYHVAAVRGSNYLQLYVNGVLQGQSSVSFAQNYGTLPLLFATTGESNWNGMFAGFLDEVSLYNVPLSSSQIAAIYAAGSAGKCKGPTITTQPQSQTVIAGTNVTFTVAATGLGPVSYQWEFNGTNIGGATNSILSLTNVQSANAGGYAAVVSDPFGAVTSSTAILALLVPPVITVQPTNQSVVQGATASFGASASGSAPLGYQWQFNGTNIAGASATNLSLSNVQPTNAGNYTFVVTNVAGSATSAVATLTVLVPPLITLQPTNQVVLQGATASFSAAATGTPPLSYQWAFSGANIAGATNTTLSLNNVQPLNAGNYTFVAANVAGSSTSAVATLTVLVPPVITLQPTNQTAVQGAALAFSAAATGTLPLGYQWQFNGTNITGATSTVFSLASVQATNAGNYTIIATNVAGSVTSLVATLTVLVPPSIALQPTNQTVIQGSAAGFGGTASGTMPLSYQWQLNGANIVGAVSTNLSLSNVQPTNAGGYSFIATNVAGSATSAVATLTVLVPPLITLQPSNQIVVQGTAASFSAAAAGTPPLAYQWQMNGTNIAGANGTNFLLSNVQPTSSGNYSFIVTNVAGSATSVVATLSVLVPPLVTLQPTNQTVIQGTAVSFGAAASGTPPLAYQWQFDGVDIAGATTTNLLLSNVQSSNAGNYTFIVTNLAGSATSAVATLTVLLPPTVTMQPTNQTVIQGTTVSFSAAGSGSPPLGYQWEFDGTSIPGATATSLVLSNVQPANAGSYMFVLTNIAGSATSAVATLTVLVPPVISMQPTNETVIEGATAAFSATASGSPPLGYQWQFNGTVIPGATGTNLVLSNVQPTNAGNYALIVTNVAGSATSAVATLSVIVPPVVTTQPTNETVIQGGAASFNAAAGGSPPLSYQWQFNGTDFPGATGTNLSLGNVQSANAGNYTFVVTNLAGSATSAVATLSVLTSPVITLQPSNQTVIQGGAAGFNAAASGALPLGYRWQFNGTDITGAASTNLLLTNVQPFSAGSYTFIATNVAGSATSAVATLTVLISPVITLQPTNQTAIQGAVVIFSAAAGGAPPLSYQWQFDGTNISGASSTNLSLSNVQPANVGNYTFIAMNLAGSATSAVAVLTVIVPPIITLQPTNVAVVQGAAASFSASASSVPSESYQWQFNGTNIGGATGTTLALNNVQATNAGGYAFIASNVAGSATSAVANLTVLLSPSIVTPIQSQTAQLSSNVAFMVTAVGTPPLSYQWYFNGSVVTNANSTNLTLLQAGFAQSGAYSVVVTNTWGGATSGPVILTVVDTVPPTISVCATNLNLSANSNCVALLPDLTGQIVASDASGSVTLSQNPAAGAALGIGTTFVTITAQDSSGNNSFCTANVTVADVTPPMILSLVTNVTLAPTTNCQWILPDLTQAAYVTASDNCGPVAIYQSPPAGTVLSFGVTNVTIAVYDTAENSTNCSITVTAPGTPSFSLQPANVGIISGNATFTSAACGVQPLSYQWQFNGSNIPGATGTSLTLTNVQPANAGSYQVIVTNDLGSAASTAASLVLLPVINGQPTNQTVAGQSTAAFSVSASGSGPLSYQWKFRGTNLTNGLYFSGATGSVLTIDYVLPSHAGGYSVVVTNIGGAVTSAVATLTVQEPSCIGITDPNLQTAVFVALSIPPTNCLGSSVLLTLTNLFACNLHITNLWGLEYASNLTGLCLSGNGVADLTPLQGLTRLAQCAVNHNRIVDLSPLVGLVGLTNLNASDNLIPSGGPLSKLTNLSGLWLSGNSISNLSFLPKLNRLGTLSLDRNNVSSLGSLQKLTNLNSLALGGNPSLTEFDTLSYLTNLTSLSVRNGMMTSLDALSSLDNMVVLDLFSNAVTDVSPLTGLAKLNSLDLSWNSSITNCPELAGFLSLTNLQLSGISVSNITFLQNLRGLSTVDLESTSVGDVSPLAGLTNLNYLVLSGNPSITNLTKLSTLRGLTYLELGRSAIGSLSFMSNLSHLTFVDLSYNVITNVGPLSGLTNLTSLVLAGNPTANFTGLSQESSLSNLWLFNNSITNADFATNFARTKYLDLEGNQIVSLSSLGSLSGLTGLGLGGNPITNYAPLSGLTNLASLRLDGSTNIGGNLNYLANLSQLSFLSLNQTRMLDLSALTNLAFLSDLYVRRNQLSANQALQTLPRLLNVDLSLNQLNLDAEGPAAAVIQTLQAEGLNVVYLPTNQPPLISVAADWFIPVNTNSLLEFSVFELPPPAQLTVTASSSNPALVPNGGLLATQAANGSWVLSATPAANQTGTATVTLSAVDDVGMSSSASLLVSVGAPVSITNLCPDLDPVLAANLSSALGKPVGSISSVDLLNLTDLSIFSASITDPCVWQWLTNLTSLNLFGTSVTNLNSLAGLNQLSSVYLYGTGVTNLAPLAGLTGLTTLVLNGNTSIDYRGLLTGFTSLTSLNLEGNSISNLFFLTNLTSLTSLDLDANLVTDLSPLAALTNLNYLFLAQNRLSNVQPLTNLLHLAYLDISLNLLDLTNPATASVVQTLESETPPATVNDTPQAWPIVITARLEWVIVPDETNETFFSVKDADPDDAQFAIGISSSNTNLVPNESIAINEYQPNYWNITLMPAPNQLTGTTTLTLTVTNEWGFSTNATSVVVVSPPLLLNSQVPGDTNLTWWTSGNAPWFGESAVVFDGNLAAQSGSLGYNQASWLETTVGGPGTLTFWWKGNAPNGDNLVFTVNGTNAQVVTGVFDWQQVTVSLPYGQCQLLWQVLSDLSTGGNDIFWVDGVTYSAMSWLELAGPPSHGQSQLILHVGSGDVYQVMASPDLVNWSSVGTVTATNSTMQLIDTNATSGTRFYKLKDVTGD